ncbi:MAG: glycosyltransferase family 39 protein, partial [Patescibacteria group bacterium]
LLMLLVFFAFLKKLFNTSIALFGLIFIGLSPIILGMSLLINPDSLLLVFLPLSVLSFLIFQKESNRKYLYLSGLFLGLSLLTKYVANILYVYFLGLIFLDYIFSERSRSVPIVQYLKKSLLNYAILVGISLAVFFALFPATWVRPEMVLQGTFLSTAFASTWPFFAGFIGLILADALFLRGRVTAGTLGFFSKYKSIFIKIFTLIFLALVATVLLNTYLGMKFWDFEAILSSPKGEAGSSFEPYIFSGNILADTYSLIFGLTPMVFVFFLFALVKNIWNKKDFRPESLIVFYFSLFILFYYIASTVNHVGATVRYQIVLYPLASIIAAIGLYQFIQWERFKKYFSGYALYFALILISAGSLYLVNPFFFSYGSAFLPSQYLINLKDMGDGSFEAATYLNSLPDAQKLHVWSDKGAVCESFVGKCVTNFNRNDIQGVAFDYFVVSTGRKSRSLKMADNSTFRKVVDFQKLYSVPSSLFRIILAGRPNNFVQIFSASEVYLK